MISRYYESATLIYALPDFTAFPLFNVMSPIFYICALFALTIAFGWTLISSAPKYIVRFLVLELYPPNISRFLDAGCYLIKPEP